MPGRVQRLKEENKTRAPLSERDQKLIAEFIVSLGALSPRRIEKYQFYLGKIGRELGKAFEDVTMPDLRTYVMRVNALDEITSLTKRDIRLFVKKFFRWLRNDEFVKWIKLGSVEPTVGPEDLLTDDELSRLRGAAKHFRDKALVETFYELAPRPHEFLGLRKNDIVFDEFGAKIHIRKGKTGPRTVRVINAAPLLANWIANHFLPEKADAPLWVDIIHAQDRGALQWIGLIRILERLCKSAGIKRRITPYHFRHTRLTHLAKTLTEAQLCAVAGWKQGSNMPQMYVHFSGRDVDDAILKAAGVKRPEQLAEVKVPKKCVRCSTVNPVEAETCSKCGMALSLEAAMRKDTEADDRITLLQKRMDAWEKIMNDPRAMELAAKGAKFDRRTLDLNIAYEEQTKGEK